MRISFLIIVYLASHGFLFSQSKADYNWIFSSNTLPIEESEGSLISFTDIGRDITYIQLSETIGNNNASISDIQGELIFYTNGCSVFDSTFNVMENGNEINPGNFHDSHCLFGNYPGPQNSIIIPVLNTPSDYLYLHKKWERNTELDIEISGIYVTIISFNESLTGKVVEKNIGIDPERSTTGSLLEAIPHQNGIDWWVVDFTKGPEENFYLSYFLNQDTIVLQHEMEIDNVESLNERCSSTSQSCFSPDGTKFAKMCPDTGFDLWDFDRSNGMISNYRHLPIETNYVTCGVGISPNSRFAYLSCSDSLWQVDLWEEDLSIGLELIDTLDKSADPFTVTNFGYQQLGPDCKIYMNTIRQYDWLHVITKPDEKGKACDFRQHSIQLPHLNEPGSFPNFPHFRIDEEDVCDPTITSVFGLPVEGESQVTVFPNPTSGSFQIENMPFGKKSISVASLQGSIVYKTNTDASSMMLDVHLASGVYFIFINNETTGAYEALKLFIH